MSLYKYFQSHSTVCALSFFLLHFCSVILFVLFLPFADVGTKVSCTAVTDQQQIGCLASLALVREEWKNSHAPSGLPTSTWSSQPEGRRSQLLGFGGMPPRRKILVLKAQMWQLILILQCVYPIGKMWCVTVEEGWDFNSQCNRYLQNRL